MVPVPSTVYVMKTMIVTKISRIASTTKLVFRNVLLLRDMEAVVARRFIYCFIHCNIRTHMKKQNHPTPWYQHPGKLLAIGIISIAIIASILFFALKTIEPALPPTIVESAPTNDVQTALTE